MANWKGHFGFGLILISAIAFALYYFNIYKVPYLHYVYFIPVIYLYSLMPDIDLESSKISWHFIGTSFTCIFAGISLYFYNPEIVSNINLLIKTIAIKSFILFIILGCLLLIIVLACTKLTRHRGAIHTIRAGLIFSILLIFLGFDFFLVGFIAFVSHLLLDAIL